MLNTFKNWFESESTYKYNIKAFVNLPWNWQAMQKYKIIQPRYYYAKENYVNGQPEQMHNDDYSLISLPNLNPTMWHDDKIDQIYQGIQMVGKTPKDFGGIDIRRQNQT